MCIFIIDTSYSFLEYSQDQSTTTNEDALSTHPCPTVAPFPCPRGTLALGHAYTLTWVSDVTLHPDTPGCSVARSSVHRSNRSCVAWGNDFPGNTRTTWVRNSGGRCSLHASVSGCIGGEGEIRLTKGFDVIQSGFEYYNSHIIVPVYIGICIHV